MAQSKVNGSRPAGNAGHHARWVRIPPDPMCEINVKIHRKNNTA